MTGLIKQLHWRYATKEFDKTKKVSTEDLNEVIESFRLTPSSFGLEPWKLIIVENEELREKLKEYSWGQSQITDASHLLVFTRILDLDKHIDKFLDNNVEITGATREQLQGYEDMMRGFLSKMDESARKFWSHEQVNIALGNVLHLLAQKNIDSCAIGGFDPKKYDELLDLEKKGLASVVLLPIGYRSETDKYSSKPKVRFKQEEIVEIIK